MTITKRGLIKLVSKEHLRLSTLPITSISIKRMDELNYLKSKMLNDIKLSSREFMDLYRLAISLNKS